MQSIESIEEHYLTPDPWGYQTNPDDIQRKNIILKTLEPYAPFENALDIGCGEGWITKDLPAKNKYGLEISKNARSRWPQCVNNASEVENHNIYDLILATGVLYDHYQCDLTFMMINSYLSIGTIILTCNIKEWEIDPTPWIRAKQIYTFEFPYREYTQKLRLFQK